MNRTLLFCTSFFTNEKIWRDRYLKWFQYYNSINIEANKILMIDDGSTFIPNVEKIPIIDADAPIQIEHEFKNSVFHFNENLGRHSVLNYPGWFRSFSFASWYAKKFNYQKVVHIESDCFLLSEKIIDHINNLKTGWNSFICKRYHFPESALQIICEDQIENFFNFCKYGYSRYRNISIEHVIPFTSVRGDFIGDRYGEFLPYPPKEADYCSQFLPEWKI